MKIPVKEKPAKKVIVAFDKANPILTFELLKEEAKLFAKEESLHKESSIFGATDGKAVGTYVEKKFITRLAGKFFTIGGNSGSGVDLPELGVDIKTTSLAQPQSSCPYTIPGQKIYGLGYALLVFVYQKNDDPVTKTSTLNIVHAILVEKERTSDYTLTKLVRAIVQDVNIGNDAKLENLISLFSGINLPGDSIVYNKLARDVVDRIPPQGYLTISNALQWRLNYKTAIDLAKNKLATPGLYKIH